MAVVVDNVHSEVGDNGHDYSGASSVAVAAVAVDKAGLLAS
jgi:hypothetical protein